ncbi:hypothetical protein OG864_45415 [Streptomyces sp. NBC_00124]|uniref:hypothetical protein n=1 Tax=Streptomyces sp. NBC_00124 TaxID=2975662 RepID=UPI0022544AF2|nr:hypothetical protein [Streptomyces sp. NBC_00124]MCX5365943.1 hypothetical protein [Streptomyces sp. NBC_00124]
MNLATTTVSILRGTTEDEFGDEADTATTLAVGIPASLIEATRTAMEPVSGTPRIIRTHVCRLPPAVDVTENDRIKDEQTNEIYIVVAVTKNSNPVLAQPLRADLKRTGRAA